MKRIIACAFLAFIFAAIAVGQRSNGYLFVAPGSVSRGGPATLHVGAGGEFVFLHRAGAGFEAGALGPSSDFSAALAVLSVNGYGHVGSDGKLDPFFTAGYSRLQRTGGVNAFNYGGGLNYWFRPHLGLRLEFRDHVAQAGSSVHYWNVRFGIAF